MLNNTQIAIIKVYIKRALESKNVAKIINENLDLLSKIAKSEKKEEIEHLVNEIRKKDANVASNLVLNFLFLF
jgi:hypothetical protein